MGLVQDALAVSQNNERAKSPFINLLEGVTGGVATAQDKALQNAHVLIQMDQMRQQMEQQQIERQRQAEFNRQMQAKIAGDVEKKTQSDLSATGTTPKVLPSQKFKEKISRDDKGNYSQSFETVDTTPKVPDVANSYEEALAEQYRAGKITLEQFAEMKKKASPSGMPSFQIVGSQDGTPVAVNSKTLEARPVKLPGKGPLMATAQTEGQANAKLYASRLVEADKQISTLEKQYDLTSVSAGVQGESPNVIKSKEVQSFEQSKRNFLNAVLRRESGAVISPSEFVEGNKQYFPVFGDKPEVLKQKSLNRQQAIEGLRNAAGQTTQKKIKVSNGTETLLIDPSDAADAEKDGYQAVP